MTIPFIKDNCVIFECHSGKLCVGDLVNDAAIYDVKPNGICHIPTDAIKSTSDCKIDSFAVDNAQFFLIDAQYYKSIRKDLVRHGAITPNFELFEILRKKYNTTFGYLVSGELYDCDFNGDGNYRIDVTLIKSGLPAIVSEYNLGVEELLSKIISSMNNLVCAKCFSVGIQNHPDLGGSPFGKGKKKKAWALAMAKYAIAKGWTATSEKGSFGDITPICPNCREQ